MKKRILGIALAGTLAVSMIAGAAISTSAKVDEDGKYYPGEGIETSRYYLGVPGAWFNEETAKVGDTAGIYWWDGTDACGAVSGTNPDARSWPGYKATPAGEEGVDNLFYCDVPKDVPTVVWNNFLNGGTDKEQAIYLLATQAKDAKVGNEEGYAEDDDTYYDTVDGFWDYVTEAYENDELGDAADSFYEHPDYGLVMNFNNMIYVCDLNKTDVNFEGKPTYVGEWYFYYGNGEYGTWPTKELTEQHLDDGATILGNITDDDYKNSKAADPTEPASDPVDPSAPADPSAPTVAPAPTAAPDATVAPAGEETTAAVEETTVAADEETTTIPAADNNDAKGSTSDSANNSTNSNGAVQTGSVSPVWVIVILAVIAGAVVYFSRKKISE